MNNDLSVELDLPRMICFRVTRYCNASCGFCLAPEDGGLHPRAEVLRQRIDWLLLRGVDCIHFCGGEPTIHASLPELVTYVHARGGGTRLTTNAITISDGLLEALRAAGTRVKASLHGDRSQHDKVVGREGFELTTGSIRRLVAGRVHTSVQTTVVAGGARVVEWVAEFCLDVGVQRLSILPFIPRGRGYERRSEYALTSSERRALRELVRKIRRSLNGRLDVRWLDFTSRPFHVVEPDGRVILEGATEALDRVLCEIPRG